MNIIVWLLAGALTGWLGSISIHTDAQLGIIPNVVIGVIAAGLAGWLLSPLVGVSTISRLSQRLRLRKIVLYRPSRHVPAPYVRCRTVLAERSIY